MIEYRVKKIVAEQLGVSVENVHVTSKTGDLGGDSLDEIEILMAVEDEFDISISDVEAEKLTTVQLMIDYVTIATRRSLGYVAA